MEGHAGEGEYRYGDDRDWELYLAQQRDYDQGSGRSLRPGSAVDEVEHGVEGRFVDLRRDCAFDRDAGSAAMADQRSVRTGRSAEPSEAPEALGGSGAGDVRIAAGQEGQELVGRAGEREPRAGAGLHERRRHGAGRAGVGEPVHVGSCGEGHAGCEADVRQGTRDAVCRDIYRECGVQRDLGGSELAGDGWDGAMGGVRLELADGAGGFSAAAEAGGCGG